MIDPATREADHASWQPLDLMDRPWSGVHFVRAYFGVHVPPLEEVRRGLRELALVSPEVGRWMTDAPPRWAPVAPSELERWLDAVVQPSHVLDVTPKEALELNAPPPVDVPFRIHLGEGWFTLHMSHAMGDGQSAQMFVSHLLRRAHTTTPLPVPWTVLTPRDRDRQILQGVKRNLRSVPSSVRHRRDLAGGHYVFDRRRTAPGHTTLPIVSGPGFPARLHEIRANHFPRASVVAIAEAGLRAAFAMTLSAPRPGFECLFNARTKAGGTALAWGNWSAGVYVRPSDDYSPESVTETMRIARAAGLADLSLANTRLQALRANGTPRILAADGLGPRITLSYIRENPTPKTFPGVIPDEWFVATAIRMNGPESLTVQAVEAPNRVTFSVAFLPDAYPPAAVEQAVRLFLSDPLACLQATSASRSA